MGEMQVRLTVFLSRSSYTQSDGGAGEPFSEKAGQLNRFKHITLTHKKPFASFKNATLDNAIIAIIL